MSVFREVKRILRDDGTIWINYGDRFNSSMTRGSFGDQAKENRGYEAHGKPQPQLKMHSKNLLGLPWRVAFALQADGWILRSDIIWFKVNPLPESVRDRPTCAHEYLFLFSKKPKYFYDQDAIREAHFGGGFGQHFRNSGRYTEQPAGVSNDSHIGNVGSATGYNPAGRNKRTVWTIPTQPTPEAHFATMPEKLVEPCILAGTSERGACVECGAPLERMISTQSTCNADERIAAQAKEHSKAGIAAFYGKDRGHSGVHMPPTIRRELGFRPTCDCNAKTRPCIVLDPFMGSGTVGRVAEKHGRHWIGFEMNEEYVKIANKRTQQTSLLTKCY